MTGHVRRVSTTRNASTFSLGCRMVCVIEWFLLLALAVRTYRSVNGHAVTSDPMGIRISPGWTRYPGRAVSPKSARNVLMDEAMAGRGVADSLTSIGTSFPEISTTISTSTPAEVLQK